MRQENRFQFLTIAGISVMFAGVAGCSGTANPVASSSSSRPTAASPSASASKNSSSGSASVSKTPSSSTSVLPPVMVSPGEKSATAKVGDTIVFTGQPPDTMISTDNPTVLKVVQGGMDGGARMNPGVIALAPGSATVTIGSHDGQVYQTVAITVEPKGTSN